MKYFFVGYMGSGKSHLGRIFAKEHGVLFIDLDDYITMMEQCSIADIFDKKGETGFREIEAGHLRKICDLFEDFTLSTGGGTPCFNANMEYMKSQGKTFFVNTDIETIVQRLVRNKRKRPILSPLKDSEIRDFVENHMMERMPYYMMADEVIVSQY